MVELDAVDVAAVVVSRLGRGRGWLRVGSAATVPARVGPAIAIAGPVPRVPPRPSRVWPPDQTGSHLARPVHAAVPQSVPVEVAVHFLLHSVVAAGAPVAGVGRPWDIGFALYWASSRWVEKDLLAT